MKAIKRRIKSVGSTMQITKAMELVASSKLRHAKQRAQKAFPYFEAQERMLAELSRTQQFESAFTQSREDCESLHIVIAGDRGLAGGYNSNVFKLVALDHANTQSKPKIIAIGRKSVEYFEKRGYDVPVKQIGMAENVKPGQCSGIADAVVSLFLSGQIGEVKLFYTKFVSSMVQEAVCVPLLPLNVENVKQLGQTVRGDSSNSLESSEETGAKSTHREVNYDPNPEAVFNRIVPYFLAGIIQYAIADSYASEQCARRIAMESASDNAEEMIENLSLLYNRARQEKITNEINEIVGGANAL